MNDQQEKVDLEELAQRLFTERYIVDLTIEQILEHLKKLEKQGKLDTTRRGIPYE